MNIHEHQAKEILKEFGAPVSDGIVVFSIDEISEKIKKLKSTEFVLKAQIHAGGRGKAGGVKLVKNINDLKTEAKKMLGKKLLSTEEEKKLKDFILKRHQIYQKSFTYLVLSIEKVQKLYL